MQDKFKDLFGITLFPHLYAIPFSILLGVAIGYYLRGRLENTPEKLPPRPKVD
jgi:hypothetical protein